MKFEFSILGEQFQIRFTPTRWILTIIFLLGLGFIVARFALGLGAVTNLSDQHPWGLWISFDVISGVALGAGAFVTAAAVYIFRQKQFHSLARPAVLTGFLGYLLVILSLIIDLGQPWDIWHPIVMWQPHSAMFEVAWCVILYTTVLALEFSPCLFEKLGWEKPLRIVQKIMLPLIILGIVLSTLHQSSLGTLLLLAPDKLHPIWYTSFLPFFFFVSSIILGLAMILFEAILVGRSAHIDETPILSRYAKAIPPVVVFYLLIKFLDLYHRGELDQIFIGSLESSVFIIEILLLAIPALLLLFKTIRTRTAGLFCSSLMLVAGVIFNRFNASLLGLTSYFPEVYIPSTGEVIITLGLISFEILVYVFTIENLPIVEMPHIKRKLSKVTPKGKIAVSGK